MKTQLFKRDWTKGDPPLHGTYDTSMGELLWDGLSKEWKQYTSGLRNETVPRPAYYLRPLSYDELIDEMDELRMKLP